MHVQYFKQFAKKVSRNPNSNYENTVRFCDTRLASSSIPQTELALAFKMAIEMSAKKIMQRTQLSLVYCFQRTAHVSSYRFGNSTELTKTPNSREDTIDHRSWENLKTCARPVTGDQCSHMSHLGQSNAHTVWPPTSPPFSAVNVRVCRRISISFAWCGL